MNQCVHTGNTASETDRPNAFPDYTMSTDGIIFSVFYFFFVLCVVFPPTEFVSSGVTLQSLFSAFLGNEGLQFVQYNIRRTALTTLLHSLLPLGYTIGLSLVDDDSIIVQQPRLSFWSIFSWASIGVFTTVFLRVLYWRIDKWSGHPLAKTLSLYSNGQGGAWTSVAADVNAEYRRIDKFASHISMLCRVIVTDSWLMYVTQYNVRLVHQSDINPSMTASHEMELSHLGNTGIQFLTIKVETTRSDIPAFSIRLNSLEYEDFREKLRAPVLNARRIVLRLTLSDRFVEAFKTQVSQNPRYTLAPGSPELERCIGCLQNSSNVKVQKLCEDGGADSCMNCYCRPMWCIDCMGKWFASRQDQSQPSTWLSSRSPCPTCRATFCMLDVCLIQPSSSS